MRDPKGFPALHAEPQIGLPEALVDSLLVDALHFFLAVGTDWCDSCSGCVGREPFAIQLRLIH